MRNFLHRTTAVITIVIITMIAITSLASSFTFHHPTTTSSSTTRRTLEHITNSNPPTSDMSSSCWSWKNIPHDKMAAFRAGTLPIMAIPSVLSPELIDGLKRDAQFLQWSSDNSDNAGVGSGSGSGSGSGGGALGQTIRKNVHQTWLSSPGEPLRRTIAHLPMNENEGDDGDGDDEENDEASESIHGNKARMESCSWVEQLRWILVHGHDEMTGNDTTDNDDDDDTNVEEDMFPSSEEERMQRYYESIWGGQEAGEGSTSVSEEGPSLLLMDGIESLHPNYMELSYLSYQPGSFYRRHIDRFRRSASASASLSAHSTRTRTRTRTQERDPTKTSSTSRSSTNGERTSERIVSFILYLGGDDNNANDSNSGHGSGDDDNGKSDKMWNIHRDGGALRVYGEEHVRFLMEDPCNDIHDDPNDNENDNDDDIDLRPGEMYVDIPPLPGTLVLLDSCKVSHAVRMTKRSRRCIVGWFGAPI